MKLISFMNSVDGSKMRNVEIQKVLKAIKDGIWKNQIESIRGHIIKGSKVKANEEKISLPAFTISATFKEKRRKEKMDQYNGLLHLDYDKLSNVREVKAKMIEDPFTYAAFISPSGNGLKVIVQTDSNVSNHGYIFNALRDNYDSMLGIESDKSVKDITRLCFVSYDPDLYLNEDAEVFKYPNHIALINESDANQTNTKTLDWVWDFTSTNERFETGNRNNYMHLFACNANRHGFNEIDVTLFAIKFEESDFRKDEIERAIKSAFENNNSEFGKYAQTTISANYAEPETEEHLSPYVPNWIYEKLPEPLNDACRHFDERERDIFLTSALSIISGGLYNVYGLYAGEKVYPNLFSFIVAPPASGKGSMKYAKQLGNSYHSHLLLKSKEELAQYKKDKRKFDLNLRKAKKDEEIEKITEPEKPKLNIFFIPANTSASKLILHLQVNKGLGCICETEADTLTQTLKQEWGGFSDILRKGFHGESISISRKTDLEFTEVNEPKFCIAITGTPNQLDTLITSVHDGLFSRFLFYSFTSEPTWKSTYTDSISKSKKEIFDQFSEMLCDKFKNKFGAKV